MARGENPGVQRRSFLKGVTAAGAAAGCSAARGSGR
ncbi:MAG TPA: twin-arginine translocation signal domain-containing protein [Chloroflexota bacterium]